MKYDDADQIAFTVVQCPTCHAVVGQRCTDTTGDSQMVRAKAHKSRRYKADGFIEGNNFIVRTKVMEMYDYEKQVIYAAR